MGKLTDRTAITVAPDDLDLIHVVDVDDPTDDPLGTSKKMTVAELKKRVHGVGFFDYNDLATATTPIAVTAGTSPVKITNDGEGAFTNKAYAPLEVTDIWDVLTDEFDWSELALGDMLDIRADIEITTTQPNQAIELSLRLAVGGSAYTIPFVINEYKTAGVKRVVAYRGIYMGDSNTIDNGAYFEVSSDANCDVKVNGWYCRIIRV